MRLKDKVAVVTGAGSGIGRGIALRFAEEGADVVVAAIREKNGLETVDLIRELGRKALMVQTDVSQIQDIDRMIGQTLETFGHIDILVNNAGINPMTSFLETTEELWERIVATNLKGTFFCSQAVARKMIQANQGGKIINIGSIESEIAMPDQVCYSSTKGGVRLMTKAMAIELAPFGINVNAIGPGYIATNITKELLDDPAENEKYMRRVVLGRPGQPRDIANAALFLASSEADYMTGTIVYVDGGWLTQ